MSIRRARTPRPTLRHLAFIAEIGAHPPDTPRAREALACLLTLRLVDHRVARGALVVSPDAPVVDATRRVIRALGDDAALRAALDAIVDGIIALPTTDTQPVVPSIVALGALLQGRDRPRAAVDAYRTVVRLADPRVHLALAFESQMQMGECLRALGDLRWADAAYAQAGVLATRSRDRGWVERVATARASFALAMGAA